MWIHRSLFSCLLLASPASAQVINEFVANHTGDNNFSFIEVAGAPSTDLTDLTIVAVFGDTPEGDDEPGTILNFWDVGTTDANGIWVSAFGTFNGTGVFDNNTLTLILVTDFTGVVGQDLDTDNNGVFDTTPWVSVLDDVSVFGTGPDLAYSTTVLTPNFDGIVFTPAGASRIPNATDTDAISDWVRNDFHGEGLPGFGSGSVEAPEVANSPGAINLAGPPPPAGQPPRIDEVVLDHAGADTDERIEIWGQISFSYATASILVIDSESGDSPGQITNVFPVGTTNGGGLWSTAALGSDSLANQSVTILLVSEFTGLTGDDLDTNNDGVIDVTPWTELFDDVALDDGTGLDLFYSGIVLAPAYDGIAGPVGGASRIPSGVDTDSTTDWVRNDFDGAGLGFGSEASLDKDEAWNTPAAINRVREADFWNGVAGNNANSLRGSIHARIDDHQRYAYSSSDTDTWDILELADEDPLDNNKIVTIYSNDSTTKFGGGQGPYNREHSWPQSYGFPDDGLDNSPRTDALQLFLADPGYNSTRSNHPFGTCSAGCAQHATTAHNGFGGVGGGYPSDSNWSQSGTYEVWNHRRGDIARAQLYLDVRFEGGSHGATGFAEPDLVLTDNTSLIQTSGGNNTTGTAYMGRLSTLLQWHLQDPVDEGERRRNDVVWTFQGNRNPFIDHPEWVACVFNDDCNDDTIFKHGFE